MPFFPLCHYFVFFAMALAFSEARSKMILPQKQQA